MINGAKPVTRGCGTRVAGGVYMEVGMSGEGMPIEHFLLDCPLPVNAGTRLALGLTARGVRLVDEEGLTHVLDWVGSESYPNVLDFVEEARRFGISRRAEGIDYSRLGPGTKLFLLHARATIANAADYHRAVRLIDERLVECPKRPPVQGTDGEHGSWQSLAPCAGLWWEDLAEGAQPHQGDDRHPYVRWNDVLALPESDRLVQRDMPSFGYAAFRRPEGVRPAYEVGIFAAFALDRLVVVRDPAANSHEEKLAKIRRSGLEVEVVDQ